MQICTANQWTGFYMIWTSSIKELKPGASIVHFSHPVTP